MQLKTYYLTELQDSGNPSFVTSVLPYLCRTGKDKEYLESKNYTNLHFYKSLYFTIGDPINWTHKNIWTFSYEMKADGGEIELIWVSYKFEGKEYFRRFVYYNIKNLKYWSEFTENYIPINNLWGNKKLINKTNNLIYSLVCMPEKIFKSIKEMKDDMTNYSKVDFSPLCNEIFANG